MPRRRPGSPGTASGPGFRRDPGHETAPGINGHPPAGKVPGRAGRGCAPDAADAWQSHAPVTRLLTARAVGDVAPAYGFVGARPAWKDRRKTENAPSPIALRIPPISDW